ncbi:MAG: hypothetical protein ACI4F9_08870 [Lachnospiraceae bacterium]
MEKENREYKDSMFVDLFYSDETATENLLSLYNALHDANLQDTSLIHKIKVDDILYKNFRNDISFEANGKVIVFGEHQSTVNPNMPLRCLMYAGRAYEQLVDENVKYKTTLVKIPTPEFYVFYNGVKNAPIEQELLLSDAFFDSEGKETMELKVKVLNINSNKAHKILEKCRVLKEYSIFIDKVREYQKKGSKAAIKDAINDCIENGILVEYLKRKGSEVRNMLTMEYSYEKDMQVKQEEAREAGRAEGRAEARAEERENTAIRMIKLGKFSIAEISLCSGISENRVRELEEENNL